MKAAGPLMRYHGGKWRIADWIIGHFPAHTIYVEPFGGSAGVLMKKPRCKSEVYNDLDGEIVNVFRVLRDDRQGRRLREQCALTPFAREEFDLSYQSADDAVERARRTLFRAWAAFGSAGATLGLSGMRAYSSCDAKHSSEPALWRRLSDSLPEFIDRLRAVLIESRPAIDVMRAHDGPQTLHYVDPPYVLSTRAMGSNRYYRHEMTDDDHRQLIEALRALEGMVIVSGYACPLYDDQLAGWRRVDLQTIGSGNGGSVARTECLWLSPAAVRRGRQPDMFALEK